MIKRIFDLSCSTAGLIVLSPLFIAIAIAIFITMGRPIFFRQTRPGLYGKPFSLVKFCTMSNCCDENGCSLPDAERLTRLGRFLRSTSLDELPELFNVINGEMSIVGPRPLLVEYLDFYTEHQARRHEVSPGITGWAQINGRNAISWEKKFDYDVWYVDHQSFWLDLKIMKITVMKILKREGISPSDQPMMPRFRGFKG